MTKYIKNKPSGYISRRAKYSFFKTRGTIAWLFIVFLVLFLWVADQKNIVDIPFIGSKVKKTEDSGSTINYGPPTEEEKEETDQFKESQGTPETAPTQPPTTDTNQKKSVTPVVSSWGQNSQNKDVEVSGFVPGIVESGGACTLTLKKDSESVSETKNATPDAKTVSCGLIVISRARLSAGSWTIIISYSSTSSEGTSQPVTLGVE